MTAFWSTQEMQKLLNTVFLWKMLIPRFLFMIVIEELKDKDRSS